MNKLYTLFVMDTCMLNLLNDFLFYIYIFYPKLSELCVVIFSVAILLVTQLFMYLVLSVLKYFTLDIFAFFL